MNKYWETRESKQREKLIDKTIADIEDKFHESYKEAFRKIESEMLILYNDITSGNRKITVSDLYKFNRYYDFIEYMDKELSKAGVKQHKAMKKELTNLYNSTAQLIGNNIHIGGKVNEVSLKEAINSIWCSDGKHWSSRIWKNNKLLESRLIDDLIQATALGEPTSRLAKRLSNDFNTSYYEADRLIRTESAVVATKATADKYKEAGLTKYRFLTAMDERTCPECDELDEKVFYIKDMKYGINAPPVHPSCRCCILGEIE